LRGMTKAWFICAKGGQSEDARYGVGSVKLLTEACPCTEFVVVLRTPEDSCEVVLERALHQLDT
jgi:hypothetical protein